MKYYLDDRVTDLRENMQKIVYAIIVFAVSSFLLFNFNKTLEVLF